MTEGICRVCLRRYDSLISLFDYHHEQQYYKEIIYCAKVEIAVDDGYPTTICRECVEELSITYNFIMKCQESDKRIRSEVKEELGSILIKEETGTLCFDEIHYSDDDHILDGIEDENFKPNVKIKIMKEKKVGRKSGKKEKSVFVCSSCGITTPSKAALIIHIRKHTGEKPYKCPHCEMKFSQTGTLKVHIQRRHSIEPRHLRERPYHCETCDGNFFSKRDLTVHTRTHTGDHPYCCEVCKQCFTQIGSLIRHRRIHTGERPYQCKLCPKRFIDNNLLKKHRYVHSDERRFICPICGKGLKTKYSLDKHLELHKERKPSICEICGITCSNQNNLKTHIKRHHSEKSGQCDVCSKHCTDLRAHMRKHTGENIFMCAVCGKGFPLKISLAVHMHKHKRVMKFQCEKDNCSRKFSKKSQLEMHMSKSHSDVFLQVLNQTKSKNSEMFR